MNIAIVDGSAICHMPDVVFDDWYHEVYGAAEVEKHPYKYQIAGTSCYAGDVWGDYSFENPLEIGSYIIFKDTAAYSIVKSNFFNGLNMPSLATYSKKTGIKILKSYNYEDFYQII